jgi:hypothetical protein
LTPNLAAVPGRAELPRVLGSPRQAGIFRSVFDRGGESVAWILRLVKIGTEGEGRSRDVMAIERPDGIADIADLGLTLSETKRSLATLQQEIVAAQVRDHAVRRPTCSRCGGGCRVKDYQDHVVATVFGQVTIRLPRFRCAACCGSESGIDWPSHCPSTPELDRLQVHLAALMAYRTAADGWFEVNYGAPSRNIVMTPPTHGRYGRSRAYRGTVGFHGPATVTASPLPGHGGIVAPTAESGSYPNDRNWK